MSLRIKELRIAAGLSQQVLADMAHVSRSQLAEIENGTKNANTLRLASIARALDVTIQDLFTEEAPAAYRSEFLSLLDQVSDSDRDMLLTLARSLAEKQGAKL